MDKISIAIPIHNVEPYIDRCMHSVVNQTYADLDIILVENGSTDGSLEKCREWVEKDARVRLFQASKGVSAARNLAIQQLKGAYCFFLDADDWLETDAIQVLYDVAQKENAQVVQCGRFADYDTGKTVLDSLTFEILENQQALLNAFFNWNGGYKWPVWGKLFASELFDGMVFDETLITGEDGKFNYEVIKSGRIRRCVISDYCGYHYYMRSSSVQHATLSRAKFASYDSWKAMYLENRDNPYALWVSIWVGYQFICSIIRENAFWEYVDVFREDMKQEEKRIMESDVFSPRLKKEISLLIHHPKWYTFIRKTYYRLQKIRHR